jgi:ribosome-binding protein aMBF1 (putative translation factor)
MPHSELFQDIQDFDSAKAALARGEDELIPAEVVNALLDGENVIKVWREFRGLSQAELAQKINISAPYLSQLESGKRSGSVDVLAAIAGALDLSVDMLLPNPT